MKVRRLLYWALWPVELVAYVLQGVTQALAPLGRLVGFMAIATNPVLLAWWLMRRRKRERERQEH